MQKRTLKIPVREMTKEIMEAMEEEGLIVRLAPHHHDIETPCGNTWFEALYEGAEGYGPHKIIALTVNRENFPGFGTHPDQEEFWLIRLTTILSSSVLSVKQHTTPPSIKRRVYFPSQYTGDVAK